MSTDIGTPNDEPTTDREDRLDALYDLREEFEIIANSDAEYAKYAEEALRTLREAGYDV